MQQFEQQYLSLVSRAIAKGDHRMDRTSVGTRALFAERIEHDWSEGFPLIMHRQLGTLGAFAEMACFLRGITDVDAMEEMGCKWWRANLEAFNKKKCYRSNTDLGPVYGKQWREWLDSQGNGTFDQLLAVLKEAKVNPTSRRLLVTAWNPSELDDMALPPCYYSFQLFIEGGKLSLLVNMRSVDVVLGLPNDIIGNAFLQLAIAKELGLEPGKLIFSLGDTHIYENHVELASKMLSNVNFKSTMFATWEYVNAPAKADEFLPDNIKVTVGRVERPKYSFPMAV